MRAKGARLWLRPGHGSEPVWLIKDGDKRFSTGRSAADREAAERDLADYLARKYEPPREGNRDPAQVEIADVLNIYGRDVGPGVRRPKELAQRLAALLAFFGDKRLSDVNRSSCRDYAAQRSSDSGRRSPARSPGSTLPRRSPRSVCRCRARRG